MKHVLIINVSQPCEDLLMYRKHTNKYFLNIGDNFLFVIAGTLEKQLHTGPCFNEW